MIQTFQTRRAIINKEWLQAASRDDKTLLDSCAAFGGGGGGTGAGGLRGSGSSRSAVRVMQGGEALSFSRPASGVMTQTSALESDDEELDKILQSYESKDGEG